MRVLCCIDGTNIERIAQAISTMLSHETLTIGVIYVTDQSPHEDMGLHRERFLRSRELSPQRQEQIRAAEAFSAKDIMTEAKRYLPDAEGIQRTGKPEREIVQCAEQWAADLVVVCSRSLHSGGPTIGPKSVGHVARFVLDHSPCPVLLIRLGK